MILSKQDFVRHCGLHGDTLAFWLEQQWIVPAGAGTGSVFADKDVARARLIRDLKEDLGVNDEGIDVILHLMDQLHGLRQALAHLPTDALKMAP